jgi:hypothetical protein
MTNWLTDVFPVKPVIAMLHLAALPGDPGFDTTAGISAVIDRAKGELEALQAGGVDGILISNEFSLPYLTKTEPITAITMARIIGGLLPDIRIPYGVNVLWDGRASIDLAVATGAQYVREIFTGVYASDFGLWDTNVGEAARHRARVGGATGDVGEDFDEGGDRAGGDFGPRNAGFIGPRVFDCGVVDPAAVDLEGHGESVGCRSANPLGRGALVGGVESRVPLGGGNGADCHHGAGTSGVSMMVRPALR